MTILAVAPLAITGCILRQIPGIRNYHSDCRFGIAADELNQRIQGLQQKNLLYRALLYPYYNGKWITAVGFSIVNKLFRRTEMVKEMQTTAVRLDEVASKLLNTISEIEKDCELLYTLVEQRYKQLEQQVSTLEKIDAKEQKLLEEHCAYLRSTLSRLECKIMESPGHSPHLSDWKRAQEVFRQTREKNVYWLSQVTTLERIIANKSSQILVSV